MCAALNTAFVVPPASFAALDASHIALNPSHLYQGPMYKNGSLAIGRPGTQSTHVEPWAQAKSPLICSLT